MISSTIIYAQVDDCEETLKQAQTEFNAGHFYSISVILKSCVDKGFTKEQQQRAYLLLTQTYLLIDDPIAAEESYLKLLKANPEFETDVLRDPIDVVYLSKKFTTAPIFSLYAKAGPNVSFVRVINNYSPFSNGLEDRSVKKSYTIKPGFQVSLGGDWNVAKNISISAALQFMSTAYKVNTSRIFNSDIFVIDDKQKWINIPLWIKYSFNIRKNSPFAVLGYSQNFLLSDKIDINFSDRFNSGSATPSTTNNLNLLSKRRNVNSSVFVGAGLKRKIGLNYWFVDLRYSFGLKNLAKNRYANPETFMRYTHVDDDFRLDNLSISIGYIHPFYKPRKLKNARTNSVLKKLRKH